jgi:uncharacterized DUF497 family protein
MVAYDWDDKKDAANQKKHGVTFQEAASVFKDPLLRIAEDNSQHYDEDRWLAIGQSEKRRGLLVVYCERFEEGEDEIIRIISARQLTPAEKRRLGRQ